MQIKLHGKEPPYVNDVKPLLHKPCHKTIFTWLKTRKQLAKLNLFDSLYWISQLSSRSETYVSYWTKNVLFCTSIALVATVYIWTAFSFSLSFALFQHQALQLYPYQLFHHSSPWLLPIALFWLAFCTSGLLWLYSTLCSTSYGVNYRSTVT